MASTKSPVRPLAAERVEPGLEGLGGLAQSAREHLPERAEQRRPLGRLGDRAEALLEHPARELELLPRAERARETQCLHVALGRGRDRGLEELLGLTGLAARGREPGELELHLGDADGLDGVVGLAADQHEQGPVRALGAVELPRLAGEAAEVEEHPGVVRVHAAREVELRERLVGVAHRLIDPRELLVERRPLRRAAAAEVRDEGLERGPRLVEAAARAISLGEHRLHRAVVWREADPGLEHLHGEVGLAEPLDVDVRRLADPREQERLVGDVRGAVGEQLAERRPGLLLAVQVRQDVPDLRARRVLRERGLEARRGAVLVARGEQRAREGERDRRPLGAGGLGEALLEPLDGLLRLAAIGVEARERVERAERGRERDHLAVRRDRAADVAELPLRERRELPVERGGARGVGRLHPLRLRREQVCELRERPPLAQVAAERLHGGGVRRPLVEVRAQGLDAPAPALELGDEPRDLEPQGETPVGVRRALELLPAQREEVREALAALEQLGQAIGRVGVGGRLLEHGAVQIDRARAVRERSGGEIGGLDAERAAPLGRQGQGRALEEQRERLALRAAGEQPGHQAVEGPRRAVDRPPLPRDFDPAARELRRPRPKPSERIVGERIVAEARSAARAEG
jgi:hypothetical protein